MALAAQLILENGSVFDCVQYGYATSITGEIVFNTAMTGYQEVLTDPSYEGQMILFTSPHIGNTPIIQQDMESGRVCCSGIITKEIPVCLDDYWENSLSLDKFLWLHKKPGIAGLDTRRITQMIRDLGTVKGRIKLDCTTNAYNTKLDDARQISPIDKSHHKVSNYQERIKILIWDFGCKEGISSMLKGLGCNVFFAKEENLLQSIRVHQPMGIVLSNGPGDPRSYKSALVLLEKLMQTNIPLLGICLGHQLLALAQGAKVTKLRYGHHGINHPVMELRTKKIAITSQNHNYVVCRENLPNHAEITHISCFDNTLQGLSFRNGLYRSFQGHPEGRPGPKNIRVVVSNYVSNLMKDYEK